MPKRNEDHRPSLLISEYMDIDGRIDAKDAAIGRRNLQNHIEWNEISELVKRQEEIVAEVGPLILAEKRPIAWRADDGSIYSIGASRDESLLTVVKLASPLTLSRPAEPRVFTDEAIVDAAFRAAANDVFGVPASPSKSSGDDDDTGDYIPIGRWDQSDTIRLPGRIATIANGVVID